MYPMEHIWTIVMLEICNHTFYAYLSRIWKMMQFTGFIRKVFGTKILLSGKFLPFLTLVNTKHQMLPLNKHILFNNSNKYHKIMSPCPTTKCWDQGDVSLRSSFSGIHFPQVYNFLHIGCHDTLSRWFSIGLAHLFNAVGSILEKMIDILPGDYK